MLLLLVHREVAHQTSSLAQAQQQVDKERQEVATGRADLGKGQRRMSRDQEQLVSHLAVVGFKASTHSRRCCAFCMLEP